jgi:hypothetical protein
MILNHPRSGRSDALRTRGSSFLIGDPSASGCRQLFGVPVLLTTAQVVGAGIILDTNMFGLVGMREGLTVHSGRPMMTSLRTSRDS